MQQHCGLTTNWQLNIFKGAVVKPHPHWVSPITPLAIGIYTNEMTIITFHCSCDWSI